MSPAGLADIARRQRFSPLGLRPTCGRLTHSSKGRDSEGCRAWHCGAGLRSRQPVLLVTHQVNSAALTGTQPTSSELVIFKRIPDGSLSVAGALVME
jgi:hypothetical protein